MITLPANDNRHYKWKVTTIYLGNEIPTPRTNIISADSDVNAVQRACGDTPVWQPGITVDTLRNYYLQKENIVVKDVERMSRDEIIFSLFPSPDVIAEYGNMKTLIDPKLFKDPWGIHGVGHTSRVLLHILNLCPPGEDLDVLKRAAVYHDIGRTHDWEDEIHGRAAIVKMEELGLIYDMFPEEEDERVFRYVVEQHCVSDKTGLDSAQFYVRDIDKQQRAQMLLKIFKDADGLDRVRLGDLDERYLRHAESKRFARKAQELFNNW